MCLALLAASTEAIYREEKLLPSLAAHWMYQVESVMGTKNVHSRFIVSSGLGVSKHNLKLPAKILHLQVS